MEDADFLTNMLDCRFPDEIFELKRLSLPKVIFCTSNFIFINYKFYRPQVRLADWAFGGIALTVMMSSTLRLPWLLRAPTFLFSGFNLLRSIYLKMNQLRYDKLEATINEFKSISGILHDLCSSLCKAVQFIQEMELIDRGFTLWVFFHNFKINSDSVRFMVVFSLCILFLGM